MSSLNFWYFVGGFLIAIFPDILENISKYFSLKKFKKLEDKHNKGFLTKEEEEKYLKYYVNLNRESFKEDYELYKKYVLNDKED